LVTWIVLHPTIRLRLFGSLRESIETEGRPGPGAMVIKTLLAQINLDQALTPQDGWGSVLARGAVCAVLLGGVALLALRRPVARASVWSGVAFGLLWALAGWWILFLPSIGWHAYYGVLGSMGFWLALACLLDRHRGLAIAGGVALALLRQASANPVCWDWGSPWYQARAGRILRSMRARLFELHPRLPPHSRLFFAELPNNIGLLAGDGPALRIWFDDSTLRGFYFSAYEP